MSVKCILTEQGGKGGGGTRFVLERIYITTEPTTKNYRPGQIFDPTGMVVKADYTMNGYPVVTGATISNYTYDDSVLTTEMTSVTISYSEGGVTQTTTQEISVAYEIITLPAQSGSLTYNGTTNSNGSAQLPSWNSNYDTNKMDLSVIAQANAGTYYATFTPKTGYAWSDNSTTSKQASWTIGRKGTARVTASTVTWTYDTESHVPTWTNYSADFIAIDGDTTAQTNVGNFTTTFTPMSNFQWGSGSSVTSAISISWSITKATPTITVPTKATGLTYNGSQQNLLASAGATDGGTFQYSTDNSAWGISIPARTNAGSYTVYYRVVGDNNYSDIASTSLGTVSIAQKTSTLTVSKSSIELSPNKLTDTFTITGEFDGTITVSSSNTSVATVSPTNPSISDTVTVSSVDETDGTATITVRVNGNNYTTVSKTISLTTDFFSDEIWGKNGSVGDEAWFSDLSAFLAVNSPRSEWVGKEKSVTLTSAVLGTTTHKIRCIGINQDGSNTVTFQTSNSLTNTTVFGSDALWANSTARTQCQNYYNAFPGKDYIKTVTKLTSDTYNTTPNLIESEETVWLPSRIEIGFTAQTNNAGEWTNGGSQTAYSYYTNNTSRIKKRGDSGSAYGWWLRSRGYSTNTSVVVIDVHPDGSANYPGYNYSYGLAPAFVIGPVEVDATWGAHGGTADATWFANLKTYLASNAPKAAWVGKEKTVTLTSAVLGTTTHKIRCIGVDQDGENTVTFQTSNCLLTITKFDNSNLQWIRSIVRTQCQNYYNAFPGKASIKTVSKGTCPDQVTGKNGTATYNDETVWLPSETEVGLDNYSSLTYSNSTINNSECTQGYNAAYVYYNSNSRRIKKLGDSGSANIWWLRSRVYNGVNNIDTITSNGSAYRYNYYNASYGLAPAFVIGNPDPSTTLNDNDWETISRVSQAGTGDQYWDIGDCKEITLNGTIGTKAFDNVMLCVFILDFNHPENGVADNNIIWGGFKTALSNGVDVALRDWTRDHTYGESKSDGTKLFNMNHWGNVTYGGWISCDLRYDILGAVDTAPSGYGSARTTSSTGSNATMAAITNPVANTLMAALPSDFRSVMRLRTHFVDSMGNKSKVDANVTAVTDAISLLAEFEVFGVWQYANQYERNHQAQMAYYAAGNSKVKYAHDVTTRIVLWGECSTRSDNAYRFCTVTDEGNAGGSNAYDSLALAPAFKT